MNELAFFVLGQAVPKQSTRFGSGHAYPDERVKTWQNNVTASALEMAANFETFGPDDEIGADIVFSLSGHKKVDIDNLCKTILDGCTGVIYQDDRQVMALHAVKRHGSDNPCVWVRFWKIEGDLPKGKMTGTPGRM